MTFDYGASLSSTTLRNRSTDVLVATADSCAEVTADSGLYLAVFSEVSVIPAGEYRLRAVINGKPLNRYVKLIGVDGEVAISRNDATAVLDSAAQTQLDAILEAAGAGDALEATSQQMLALLQAMPTTIDTALGAYRTNGVASGDDLAVVSGNAAQAVAVAGDTYTYVQGLPSALDNAAAVDAALTLQHGGGDWTDSGVGTESDLLVSTTIATLASQTSFTLTAGSADNDAYNRQLVVITDAATSTQKARGIVSDYVGSTKTVTLALAPAFTIAAGDSISIIAVGSDVSSAQMLTAISSAVVSAGITTTVNGMPSFLRVGDARTVANGSAINVRLYSVDDDSLLFGLGTNLFEDATITFSLRRSGTDSADGIEDAAIPCTWVEDGDDGYVQIAYEADALDDCDAMDKLKEKDCHRWGIKFQWGTDDPITPIYGNISVLRKIVTTQ